VHVCVWLCTKSRPFLARRIKQTLEHIEEMKAEEAHEAKVLLRQRERSGTLDPGQ